MRRLDSTSADFEAQLARLLAFEAAQDQEVERATADILEAVRSRGDDALIEFTARFDRWNPRSPTDLLVSPGEMRAALESIDRSVREALELAARRIRAYHEHQRQESWRSREADGTELGQQVTPLDRVGLYVPGGKAA